MDSDIDIDMPSNASSSSDTDLPSDPLDGLVFGSQSQAAKRGEYVPTRWRSGVGIGTASAKGSGSGTAKGAGTGTGTGKGVAAAATSAPARARPYPKPKPWAKPTTSATVKGKGKQKEEMVVIEISSDDDEDEASGPLLPSRRPNMASGSASTSSRLRANASTVSAPPPRSNATTNARKRTVSPSPSPKSKAKTTNTRTRTRTRATVGYSPTSSSEDDGDDNEEDGVAFVTADEGPVTQHRGSRGGTHLRSKNSSAGNANRNRSRNRNASSSSSVSVKRRRIDARAVSISLLTEDEDGDGEGVAQSRVVGKGKARQVDEDEDVEMLGPNEDPDQHQQQPDARIQQQDADAGHESDTTLEYVSERELDAPPAQVQGAGVPEEQDAQDSHDAQDEQEKPFPDFTSLRKTAPSTSSGEQSAKEAHIPTSHIPAAAASPAASPSRPQAREQEQEPENAVPGPSQPRPRVPHASADDRAIGDDGDGSDGDGMSPEDAAAVYAAMFGEEEDIYSLPARIPSPLRVPSPAHGHEVRVSSPPRDDAGSGGEVAGESGIERARVSRDQNEDEQEEEDERPMFNWSSWDPLRTGKSGGSDAGGKEKVQMVGGENADEVGAKVDKGKGRASDVDGDKDHVMQDVEAGKARTPSVRGMSLAAVDAVRAAKGAFTFSFRVPGAPGAPGAPAGPEVPAVPVAAVAPQATGSRQQQQQQQQQRDPSPPVESQPQPRRQAAGVVADPWSFMFANALGPPPADPVEPLGHVKAEAPIPAPPPAPALQGAAAPVVPPAQAPIAPAPAPALAPVGVVKREDVSIPVPGPSRMDVEAPREAPAPPAPPALQAPAGQFTFVFGARPAAAPAAPSVPAALPVAALAPASPPRRSMFLPQPQLQIRPPPAARQAPIVVPKKEENALPQRPLFGPAAPVVHQAPIVQPKKEEALPQHPMFGSAPIQAPVPAAPAPARQPPVAVAVTVPHPALPAAPIQQPAVAPPVDMPPPAPAPAPAPVPAPTREQLIQRTITQITEILPDVEPGYLLAHVATYIDAMGERTAEHVLGLFFEMEAEGDGGYPRAVAGAGAERDRERVQAQAQPQPQAPPAPPVQEVRRAGIQPQPMIQVPAPRPQPQPVAGGSNQGRAPAAQAAQDEVNYEDVNRPRPSPEYIRLAMHYLRIAFPFIPKNIITGTLAEHKNLYAPTYLTLHAAEQRYTSFPVRDVRPYRCNSTRYPPGAERRALANVWSEQFGEEWLWVEARQSAAREVDARLRIRYEMMRAGHNAPRAVVPAAPVAGPARVPAQVEARAVAPPVQAPAAADNGKGKQRAVDVEMAPPEDQPAEEEGDIECGCCFSNYTFDKMVQCPDAHLFCSDCVSQYAATQLGSHNPSLVCMHSSDCKLPFPESELRRVLTPTLMALYSRLTAQRAIAAAGLEGLEECPFCDWQCVIEVPIEVDRLFRCGNAEGGCGVVSCRECKKKDHLPKTCKEMEEDKVLDGQHAIEEAMTRALMRNCPNQRCKKAFVKETGCNKMTCPHCRTMSCYVCRKVITGYDHFDVMPGAPANTAVAGKCKLWENVEERHAIEVREAAARAAEELKRANPEIDHEAIKVDIPAVPPPAPAGRAAPAVPARNAAPVIPARNAADAALQAQQQLIRARQDVVRLQLEAQARQAALAVPAVNAAALQQEQRLLGVRQDALRIQAQAARERARQEVRLIEDRKRREKERQKEYQRRRRDEARAARLEQEQRDIIARQQAHLAALQARANNVAAVAGLPRQPAGHGHRRAHQHGGDPNNRAQGEQ